MGRTVIVGYKPKPGKNGALKALIKTHLPRLKAEGLVTDRESIIMEAGDGTIVEVFEWLSQEAINNAHKIQRCCKCGANTPKFVIMYLLGV